MIGIDKKIAKTALKLTKSYSDELHYEYGSSELSLVKNLHEVIRSEPLGVAAQDIIPSIDRLIAAGYFKKTTPVWSDYFFSITPKLLHKGAFFWDDFKKRFWTGFACGVLTGIVANYCYDILSASGPSILQKLSALL